MSQPAHKFRDGTRQVTIWRNSGENGPYYTVNPSRGYKKGDDWNETDSLRFDDLLAMAKLLSEAHSWIINAKRADAKAKYAAANAAEYDEEESVQEAA